MFAVEFTVLNLIDVKESAEKSVTEFKDSVTSEEQGSLAETKEKKNNKEVKDELPEGEENIVSDPDDVQLEAPPEVETKVQEVEDNYVAANAREEAQVVASTEENTGESVEESEVAPEVTGDIPSAIETEASETPDVNDEPPVNSDEVAEAGASVEEDTESTDEETEVAPESAPEVTGDIPSAIETNASETSDVNDEPPVSSDEAEEAVASAEEATGNSEEETEVAPEPAPQVTGDIPAPIDTTASRKSDDIEQAPALATAKENTDDLPVEQKGTQEQSLAVNASDAEDDVVDESDELDDEDFSQYNKEELVEVAKKLGKLDNPIHADRILRKITPFFNQIKKAERKEALDKFVADNGTEDDFYYKPDELEERFDANYQLIKDKKSSRVKELESERTQNLVLAEDILSELREFMDSEESNASFNQFKSIQKKWHDLGDVPSQHSKTLWANYNALIHRFYDQRSIYFELKELDRRKNYETKLLLCEKAEELEKVENLRDAIRLLNDLHHEFKHLGPVPQELQEDLWERFKIASDKVYERRKSYVNELKAELQENLVKKSALVEKIAEYAKFNSDRIKEWNEKTKELIALQKEWDTIGGLPKEKAKEINRGFWTSFKKFFSNKHQFFKKLDADRDTNLEKKQQLLARAVELKDSQDWDTTAQELKKLQVQWREIGPVPEKMRKKVYEEFKAACDQFFENRRKGLKSSQEQYKENLKLKREIIKKIGELSKDSDKNLNQFNELRKEFAEAGYVPRKNINSVKNDFQAAVENFLSGVTSLNPKEKTEISLATEFSNLAKSEYSESDLYHKEQAVRRQIGKLEDDIALWRNNLEFFAASKSTDKLRKDVNKKIDDADEQLESLRRQLKMLRSL